jgi:hypothetical protein
MIYDFNKNKKYFLVIFFKNCGSKIWILFNSNLILLRQNKFYKNLLEITRIFFYINLTHDVNARIQ